MVAEGVKGFDAPGERAGGSFSVENGRQPRTLGNEPLKGGIIF